MNTYLFPYICHLLTSVLLCVLCSDVSVSRDTWASSVDVYACLGVTVPTAPSLVGVRAVFPVIGLQANVPVLQGSLGLPVTRVSLSQDYAINILCNLTKVDKMYNSSTSK